MNLHTTYLGFELPHPFVPGAGPLSDDLDSVRRLEDAGAPLIQLRSLFEEQIVTEQVATFEAVTTLDESFGEAMSFFTDPDDFVLGPHEYLDHLRRVKQAVGVPVFGSLNGTHQGGWLEYGKLIEQAGADALELNVYELGADPHRTGAALEAELIAMVQQLKHDLSIPLAVKLSPYYASVANLADQLDQAGVDALVLFNRFYQPDIDVEELEAAPVLELSHSSELLLRLRWLAVLSAQLDDCDLAVTGGVHTATDGVKAIMAGADVVQMVSSLLRQGPSHLTTIRDQTWRWMQDHEYNALAQMRGAMNLNRCPDPKAYERSNYMRILQSWSAE